MSRLDYVTVAIVGICILAIAFLVYKMTNVFNGEKPKDKTEIAADSIETEEDDVYDYEIDKNVDSTGAASGNAVTDNSKPTSTTEKTASDAPADDDVKTTTPSSTDTKKPANTGTSAADDADSASPSEGKYMVLAGSFTKRALADAQKSKLNKMGYNNASVEIFDRGKYAVVLVDRFGNMADAERAVKKLTGDGVKSYVKIKS